MSNIIIGLVIIFSACKKDDNKINDLLLGSWERFVEIDCSVDNCWHEKMTFKDNSLYSFYELRPFNNDWILIKDSLYYKIENGNLTLENRHGAINKFDIKTINKKKLIYENSQNTYEWERTD